MRAEDRSIACNINGGNEKVKRQKRNKKRLRDERRGNDGGNETDRRRGGEKTEIFCRKRPLNSPEGEGGRNVSFMRGRSGENRVVPTAFPHGLNVLSTCPPPHSSCPRPSVAPAVPAAIQYRRRRRRAILLRITQKTAIEIAFLLRLGLRGRHRRNGTRGTQHVVRFLWSDGLLPSFPRPVRRVSTRQRRIVLFIITHYRYDCYYYYY